MIDSIHAVYGASGFGREVMPLMRAMYQEKKTNFLFIDDDENINHANGHEVITYNSFLKKEESSKNVIIAISNSQVREELTRRCIDNGIDIIDIRSLSSIVMDNVVIGVGHILCHNVILTSNIKIGISFHANIYSYIGHDCEIGNYVTFAPAVKCNGNVVIEDHVYVGTGAIIKQGKPDNPLIIGKGAVIGMGTLITKSVPAGAIVIGNPSKPLERKGVGR